MPLNQAFDPLTVWNCHVSPRNSEWDLWLTHTTFGWWFVCLFLNQRKKLFGRKHVQVSLSLSRERDGDYGQTDLMEVVRLLVSSSIRIESTPNVQFAQIGLSNDHHSFVVCLFWLLFFLAVHWLPAFRRGKLSITFVCFPWPVLDSQFPPFICERVEQGYARKCM